MQGLDEEMAVVQRGKEIKSIVEQTLYFLCSANHRLSVWRWKKVLVNIIKEKISLAEQPLRNAKRFLFGEDFLSISFKQAELSQDLAKNLSNTSKPKHPYQEIWPIGTGNALGTQIPSLSPSQTDQKAIGRFITTRDPQTKTQHIPVTKCLDLAAPLIDAEVLKLLSKNTLYTGILYSRLFLAPVIDFQIENISYLKRL